MPIGYERVQVRKDGRANERSVRDDAKVAPEVRHAVNGGQDAWPESGRKRV